MKNIYYRQEGGLIAQGAPVAPQAGMVPPAPAMPAPAAPMATMVPSSPAPRKSFAERVMAAEETLKGGSMSALIDMGPMPVEEVIVEEMPMDPMMDAQGDGPVRFEEGAGGYADGMVGPDMGMDDVDAMIPEGSMVMNAEAEELYGPELDDMVAVSGPPSFNEGTPPMVRAKLTRGERVIAPHTTKMFMSDLEAMNAGGLAYRENGGMVTYMRNGGISYDRQVFLRRLLETVKPGSRDEEIILERLGITPQYKQEGGFIDQAKPYLQGTAEGLPERGKIGQLAGFIGSSLKGDPDYSLLAVNQEKPEVNEEEKANEMVVQLATEAKSYVDAAGKAGDFIHGFLTGDEAKLDAEEQGILDQATDAAKGLIGTVVGAAQTVAGAFNQTARVREEALMRIAARKFPDSYTAFTKLQAVGENLALAYLPKLGPGPKTDTDLRVAREAVFNIKAPSHTWVPQLDATISRITGKPVMDPVEASEPNPAAPEVDNTPGSSVSPAAAGEHDGLVAKDYGQMSRIHGATKGGTGEESLIDKGVDAATEAAQDAADTVKSWFS